jgi:TRAP-type transport system periplasmic protein
MTAYYNSTGSLATRLHEVAPFIIDCDIGAMAVNVVVFNKERWDGLPKDVQDAIRIGVEKWEAAYLKRVDASLQPAIDTMVKAGATLIEWTPAERERWAKSLPPLGLDWVKEHQARNPAAQVVLATYMYLLRKNGVRLARNLDKE